MHKVAVLAMLADLSFCVSDKALFSRSYLDISVHFIYNN